MRMILAVFIAVWLCPLAAWAQDEAQTPATAAPAPARTESAAPAPAPNPAPAAAKPDTQAPSPSPDNQPVDALPRKYIEVWNTGNFDLLKSFFSMFYMTSHEHRVIVEESMLIRVITFWRRSMPDLNFKIADTIIQGDKVAMRLTYTGTYKAILFPFTLAPVNGAPPKTIHGTEMLFFQVKNGKIVEIWEEYDEMVMRFQMGGVWGEPKKATEPPSNPATKPAPPTSKP
jgi:predicted ester cyclase